MYTDYDVIVIGSGPAGLAAGIYTSRAGFSTLILEKGNMGGELMNRQAIENYPGFAEGIQGPELGSAMLGQAVNAGAEVQVGEAVSITDKKNFKIVKTDEQTLTCKGIILATGSHPRKLGIPGEAELAEKGVFYCATCDGPQLAGKDVVVAGAGDSGITEALHLGRLGCRVLIIEFMPKPNASMVLLERAEANPNIDIICNTEIKSIAGEDWVTGVDIEDRETGERRALDIGGVLVRIGMLPNTEFARNIMALEPDGRVPVDGTMQTPVPGIFAAGDIRSNSPAQIGAAVGDGVCAAMALGRYLNTL